MRDNSKAGRGHCPVKTWWERRGNVVGDRSPRGRGGTWGRMLQAAGHVDFILRTAGGHGRVLTMGVAEAGEGPQGLLKKTHYERKGPESPALFQNVSWIWVWGNVFKLKRKKRSPSQNHMKVTQSSTCNATTSLWGWYEEKGGKGEGEWPFY